MTKKAPFKDQLLETAGALIASVRARRNLSINDIKGSLTQPAVTYLEHGRSSISFTSFHSLLSKIYMSANEFFLLSDPHNSFLHRYVVALQAAENDDDLVALSLLREEIISEFPGSRRDGPKDMLLLGLTGIEGYIKGSGNFTFSAENSIRLKGYFTRGDKWYMFEYTLFSVTAQFLPTKVAVELVDDMFQSFRSVHIRAYDNAVASILFNLCFSWLTRNEVSSAISLLTRAQKELPQSSDPYISLRVYLLQQSFIFLGNHSKDAFEHIKLIEDGLKLYDPKLHKSDVQWLKKLGIQI